MKIMNRDCREYFLVFLVCVSLGSAAVIVLNWLMPEPKPVVIYHQDAK